MLTVADTAFSIAVVRADEGDLPAAERLFEDPYAHLFRAAGAHAAEGTARYLALQFFRDGVRLRTRFIDDALREGLIAGIDQVVILGAGFDSRGMRMPEIAARNAAVYEIDFPDQMDRKAAIFAAAGVTLPPAVTYVPFDFATADLETALTPALEARGFRRGGGALFIWEGVIGYVDEVAINHSLRFMAEAGGAKSRLIFTFHDGAFGRDSAVERTRRMGFTTCEESTLEDAWRRYLPGDPHPAAVFSKIGIAIV